MCNVSSLFVLLIRLSELLLLPDLVILPCCVYLSSTDDNFSSFCLFRRNSDGLTFESDEQVDVLFTDVLFECCGVVHGDGGVSVIDTGDSTECTGPSRRATFGGGLKAISK